MKQILTIFKKELKDTLRDRRTLLAMVVFPVVLMPLLLTIVSKVTVSQANTAKDKNLEIAIIDNGNGAELVKRLKRRKDMVIFEDIKEADLKGNIREENIHLGLVIGKDFDATIAGGKTANVNVYYNSTENQILIDRFEKTLNQYSDVVLTNRLDSLGITEATITPLTINKVDAYTSNESFAKMAGGLLPYFFVILCLVGAMYPAIDLFTGEKERGTIETILTVPTSRMKILLGKMMVVVTTGVMSGILMIVGALVALKVTPDIPAFIGNIVMQLLTPSTILLILLMLIPLTIFFAGILIPASIYAKSFKEAQSLIQPMMIFVFVPLIIGTMPSVKLTYLTAMIPVLNVGLATREIVAGTIDYGMLAVVYLSLIALATVAIMVCVRWFGDEGNILRV